MHWPRTLVEFSSSWLCFSFRSISLSANCFSLPFLIISPRCSIWFVLWKVPNECLNINEDVTSGLWSNLTKWHTCKLPSAITYALLCTVISRHISYFKGWKLKLSISGNRIVFLNCCGNIKIYFCVTGFFLATNCVWFKLCNCPLIIETNCDDWPV